jgi:hypothetical protein
MRIMYDACDPARPPANAVMVAGYLYGPCAWPASGWTRFRDVVQVRIATVQTINDGQVLDVERGDADVSQAPGWCARARLRGQIPTVYCSQANVSALLEQFRLHEVPAPLLWVAQWDGVAELPDEWIAKQYLNDNALGFDVSVVADFWPGVDPAPIPIMEDDNVHLVQLPGDGGVWCLFEYAGVYAPVPAPPVEADLTNLGAVKATPITEATHTWLRTQFPQTAAAPAVTTPSTEA